MIKKWLWLIVSSSIIVSLVFASCSTSKQPTTTPTTSTTSPTTKTTTPIVTQTTTTKPTTTTTPTTTSAVKASPQYGGEIRVHLWNRSVVGSWDPIDGDMYTIYPLDLIYDRMAMGDWSKAGAGTGEYTYDHYSWFPPEYMKGNILESWQASPDGLTYTFNLRKGIYFHNKPPVAGREATADDLAYTIQRATKSPAPGAWVPYFLSATAVNKYTVEVKLKASYYDIIWGICYGFNWLMPREMVDAPTGLKDWKNACGTGPFVLKDYVASNSVTFERNPNYWNYDEVNPKNRLPYVNLVKELLIADEAAQLAALRTGKIDVTWGIPYEKYKTLKATSPSLKARGVSEYSRAPMFMFRVDEAPFNNVKVRQAMQMGINYQEIINSVYDGNGYSRFEPILPLWGNYYIPDDKLPADVKELFTYNPTKAKQLLKEAGYPDGFKTTIVTQPSFVDRASIFADYWKKIGVEASLQVLEPTAFLGLVYGGNAHGIIAKGSGIAEPIWAIEYFKTGGRFNNGGFSDPAYDAFIEKLVTTTDLVKRRDYVIEGTLVYYRTVPCISFPLGNIYNYWQPWVGNFKGETSIGGPQGQYVILSRLWIDQSMKKSMGY